MSNIIDTRQLAERLSELKDLRDAIETAEEELATAKSELEDARCNLSDASSESEVVKAEHAETEAEEAVEDAEAELENAKDNFSDDERKELEELEELESEISEFHHGETMIPEDEFTDYCKEMLEDIGDLPKDLPSYIENNIDWDGVASDLKADYIEVTYNGETYLVRSC